METYEEVLKAEKQLYDYFNDRSGTFMHNLISAFIHADADNFKKLSIAFPALSIVVAKYKTVEGYWDELQKRIEC